MHLQKKILWSFLLLSLVFHVWDLASLDLQVSLGPKYFMIFWTFVMAALLYSDGHIEQAMERKRRLTLGFAWLVAGAAGLAFLGMVGLHYIGPEYLKRTQLSPAELSVLEGRVKELVKMPYLWRLAANPMWLTVLAIFFLKIWPARRDVV